jgi:dihydroxyacetone kinase
LSAIDVLEGKIEDAWEHCISEGKKNGIEVFVTIGNENDEAGMDGGEIGDGIHGEKNLDRRMEQVDLSLMETIKGFEEIVQSLMTGVEQLVMDGTN